MSSSPSWLKSLNNYKKETSSPSWISELDKYKEKYIPTTLYDEPLKKPVKTFNNIPTYQEEYKQLHPKTKEYLKNFTVGNSPDKEPISINNQNEYALYMMKNEDDSTKSVSKFIPNDGQVFRDKLIKEDTQYRANENLELMVNNVMSGGNISLEDLSLVEKHIAGDNNATQQLLYKNSLRSLDEIYSNNTNAGDSFYIPNAQERQLASQRLKMAMDYMDAFGEEPVDTNLSFIEKEIGDPLDRGAQGLIKFGGYILNFLPTIAEGFRENNLFFKIEETQSNILKAKAEREGKEYKPGKFDLDLEALEESDKKLEEYFYEKSKIVSSWADYIDAKPALGKYAKPAENFIDIFDPFRILQIAGENGPLMAGLAATSLIPKIGPQVMLGALTAGTAGGLKEKIYEFEKQNPDIKLKDWQRDTIPAVAGGLVASLDALGLGVILNRVSAPVKGRVMGALFKAVSEGGTESAQEAISVWSQLKDVEFAGVDIGPGYRELTKEDITSIKAGGVAGLVMGFGPGLVTSGGNTLKETNYAATNDDAPSNVKLIDNGNAYQIIVSNNKGVVVNETNFISTIEEATNKYNKLKNNTEDILDGEFTEIIDETNSNYALLSGGASTKSDIVDYKINTLISRHSDGTVTSLPSRNSNRSFYEAIDHYINQDKKIKTVISNIQDKLDSPSIIKDKKASAQIHQDLQNALELKKEIKTRINYLDKKKGLNNLLLNDNSKSYIRDFFPEIKITEKTTTEKSVKTTPEKTTTDKTVKALPKKTILEAKDANRFNFDKKTFNLKGKTFKVNDDLYIEITNEVKGQGKYGTRVEYKILTGPLKNKVVGKQASGAGVKKDNRIVLDLKKDKLTVNIDPSNQIKGKDSTKAQQSEIIGGRVDLTKPVENIPKNIVDRDAIREDKEVDKQTTDKAREDKIYEFLEQGEELTIEDFEYLESGFGFTSKTFKNILKIINDNLYSFSSFPRKIKQQFENIGINKDNYKKEFKKTSDNFKDLKGNRKNLFKKAFNVINKWYNSEGKNQVVSEENNLKYAEITEEKSNQINKELKTAKETNSSFKNFIKNTFQVLSDRALAVGPEVKKVLRGYIRDIEANTDADIKKVQGWLKKLNDIKKENINDYRRLHVAILARDKAQIDFYLKKYNAIKEFKTAEKVLEDIYGRAKAVFGDSLGRIEKEIGKIGYYPRTVIDLESLQQALNKFYGNNSPKTGAIDNAIDSYIKDNKQKLSKVINELNQLEVSIKRAKGNKNLLRSLKKRRAYLDTRKNILNKKTNKETLSQEEKVKIINSVLFRRKSSKDITKSRRINTEELELYKVIESFYKTPENALIDYIEKYNKGIAKQKLFGTAKNVADAETLELDESSIFMLFENKLKSEDSYTKQQQEEIIQIFSSLLDVRQAGKTSTDIRMFGYLGTMGNFISAVTQIGDVLLPLSRSLFSNPLDVFIAAAKSTVNKSDITMNDVWIENMANEYRANPSTFSNITDTVFKFTLLKKIDRIGKETLINSQIKKFQGLAKKYNKQRNRSDDNKSTDVLDFEFKLREIFPESEIEQTISDLNSGNITPNTLTLAYNIVLDHQPVAISEMPSFYAKNPGKRIFYQLKTWTIRTLNTAISDLKTGLQRANELEKQGKIKAARKMRINGFNRAGTFAAVLLSAGAGVDVLKDWIQGKDVNFSDSFIENLLRMVFLSSYIVEKPGVRQKVMAGAQSILPAPASIAIDVADDVFFKTGAYMTSDKYDNIKDLQMDLSTTRYIPFIGNFIYYGDSGKGRVNELNKEKRRLKKLSKERKLDSSGKKRLRFVNSELSKIRKKRGKKPRRRKKGLQMQKIKGIGF